MNRRQMLFAAAAGWAPGAMPRVPFGAGSISRLIVGGNPVSGTSHQSAALSQEMTDYFTAENVKRLLRGCSAAGIDTWQSRGDRHILRLLHEYRQEGGRVQWIAQTATEIEFGRNLAEMSREKPLGIYHHGLNTDRAWASGNIERVRDTLRAIRDSGTQVGLGTHIPEVIDYVESRGWDVDFYMTCLYNLSRTPEEQARLAGRQVSGELFRDADRTQMLERVRRTRRQCLIFKVYGAGRHCDSTRRMMAALDQVAGYAKPRDAVVIGMFPKYGNQAEENAALFRRAFSPS